MRAAIHWAFLDEAVYLRSCTSECSTARDTGHHIWAAISTRGCHCRLLHSISMGSYLGPKALQEGAATCCLIGSISRLGDKMQERWHSTGPYRVDHLLMLSMPHHLLGFRVVADFQEHAQGILVVVNGRVGIIIHKESGRSPALLHLHTHGAQVSALCCCYAGGQRPASGCLACAHPAKTSGLVRQT